MLDSNEYRAQFADRRVGGLHDLGYTSVDLLNHWECEYKTAFAAAADATIAAAKAPTSEKGFAQFV